MSSRVQDLQKLLYLLQAEVIHVEQMAASWETVLKAGERSKMHCGVSRLQSSVQTIHRQLDELTQQAVEGEMGDPRSNPDYAPTHLEATLEAIKEEGTASDRSQQTLMAQGAAPNIEVMSVLQGRLHFFQELLRCVTEAVAKNDHASTLQSIVRHRPQNPKRAGLPALSARQSPELVEEPPQMPPPVEQVRADLCESSPLPPDRGPAAMGRREISLAQMREEVDEERKRYIAYHLVRDEHRAAGIPYTPSKLPIALALQGTIAVHTQSTEGRTIMFKKKIDPRANGQLTSVASFTAWTGVGLHRSRWQRHGLQFRMCFLMNRGRFKLLARMALGAKLLSMAAVSIGTGRRHQIRLHAAHIGHPVAADGKYSCHSTCSEDLLWCPSTFLHRYRLAFWAPSNGRQPDTPLEANECRLPLSPPMREALRLLSPVSPRSAR
ncbi:unnamed protein product, partial [Symbiodinium necroappetens]